MIISKHSILRKVPKQLAEETNLLIDGIRYSVDIIDVSYNRLFNELVSFTNDQSLDNQALTFPAAFTDVWSIIDAAHQLRELIRFMIEKSNKRNPEEPKPLRQISNVYEISEIKLYEFLECTSNVTLIRNRSQHLKNRIDHLISKKKPIWGTIYWVDTKTIKETESTLSFYIYGLVSGSIAVKEHIEYPKAPTKLSFPVGAIILNAHDLTLNISELFVFITLAVRNLENQLSSQFKSYEKKSGDIFMQMFVDGRTSP